MQITIHPIDERQDEAAHNIAVDDRLALARAVAARQDELFIYNGDGSNEGRIADWPSSLSADVPYAVFVADGERLHTVAFDFDPKNGDPAADVLDLRALLDELGICFVECVSGPTGGRHVLFRVDGGIDLETLKELRNRSWQAFQSLDHAAMSNVSRQLIRPPLAPHRLGGQSELVDVDPWEARMILNFGNEPFLIQRLTDSLPVRVVPSPPEPVPHAIGGVLPRRELSKKVRNRVRYGDRDGRFQSRSEVTQSVANSYYLAGLSFEQLAVDLADPGNVGGERYRESGDAWLCDCWENAQTFTEANPLPDMSYLIDEAARRMASETWSGSGGVKERLVMTAHLAIALKCNRCSYTASDRQVSEESGVDRKTVAHHQRSLVERGILAQLTLPGVGVCARRPLPYVAWLSRTVNVKGTACASARYFERSWVSPAMS